MSAVGSSVVTASNRTNPALFYLEAAGTVIRFVVPHISFSQAPVEGSKPDDGFVDMYSYRRRPIGSRMQTAVRNRNGLATTLAAIAPRPSGGCPAYQEPGGPVYGQLIGADDERFTISGGYGFCLFACKESRQLLRIVDIGSLVNARRHGLVAIEKAIEQVLPID